MGRFADDWLADQPDLRVVARILALRPESRRRTEIGLDFTRAGTGWCAMRLLEAGLHGGGHLSMDPAQG
ncbi:MAG: hypothetical protein R3F17_09755 [Planctomycetota bacterium]